MIHLVPMSDEVYETFRAHSCRGYALEKIEAGTWEPAQALQRAETEYDRLLPQGTATPDHYLFSIVTDDNTPVGTLWFAVADHGAGPIAFVYDIEIAPDQQRNGYGIAAMKALEDKVRELGLSKIGLHVFGHNKAAQELYTKAGFVVTDINMAKSLA